MDRAVRKHRLARRATPVPMTLLVAMVAAALTVAACGASTGSLAAPSVPPSTQPGASGAPSVPPSTQPGASEAPTGSAAPSGGGGHELDVCGLISAADMSKVVGGQSQANPVPGGGWTVGQCAWNTPKGSFLVSVGTTSSLVTFGDPAAVNPQEKLAQFRQQTSAKELAGIGDGAAVAPGGMAAYRGDKYLEVLNVGLTQDQLIKVVRAMVARL